MICNEYVISYIRNTIRKNEGILAEMEKYAAENYVPIVEPEVARLLCVLCRLAKPLRVLEVGTAIGYSAIMIARSIGPDGRVDTIERSDSMADKALEYIRAAGQEEKIRIIRGEAADVLNFLDKSYDMIFLDAAKGQYNEFFPECRRLLKPGGLLISDNVLYKGMVASEDLVKKKHKTLVYKMREYLETICNSDEFDTSILPVGDGVALSYRLK